MGESKFRIEGVRGQRIGGSVVRVECDPDADLHISDVLGVDVRGDVVQVISTPEEKIAALLKDLKPFLGELSDQHRGDVQTILDRLIEAKTEDKQTHLDDLKAFILTTSSSVLANVIAPYFN
ncbi:hypothetical protein [Pseudomonas sp. ACN8]|uniref:hypothetical protein n=1 Tax=Pseudomonas sp. ACN8 TaxID=1920428 RepID=UPI000BB2ED62|nr:hypothetical protein [Pseudomonas sp. ACN8]